MKTVERHPFTEMDKIVSPTLRLREGNKAITDVVVTIYHADGPASILVTIKSPAPWVLHEMQHAGDEYIVPINDDGRGCLVWWGINKDGAPA